jgi:hypothetical protein
MPKWLGAVFGGIFGFVLIGTGLIAFHVTRPAQAAVPPRAEIQAPALVAAPVTTVETPVPVQPAARPRPSKKLRSTKSRARIIARHDTREKRKSRDELARMLGL